MLSHKIVLLVAFAGFCGFSLAVKENYPFSNYPMYGDPDPVSEYYHLADGTGKPLPVHLLTGVTCPQLGKILRKYGDERAQQLHTKRKKLLPAEWDPICRRIFSELRSKTGGNQLPDKLRIMHTTIEFKDGKIVETPSIFFAE